VTLITGVPVKAPPPVPPPPPPPPAVAVPPPRSLPPLPPPLATGGQDPGNAAPANPGAPVVTGGGAGDSGALCGGPPAGSGERGGRIAVAAERTSGDEPRPFAPGQSLLLAASLACAGANAQSCTGLSRQHPAQRPAMKVTLLTI